MVCIIEYLKKAARNMEVVWIFIYVNYSIEHLLVQVLAYLGMDPN